MSNTLLTLFGIDRYEQHYRTGFWRDDTLYALVAAHATRAPDRIAIRSAHGDVSYRTLLAQADAFAAELAHKGVNAGQRVAVWSPSRAGLLALGAESAEAFTPDMGHELIDFLARVVERTAERWPAP